jgi:hypothetical protein
LLAARHEFVEHVADGRLAATPQDLERLEFALAGSGGAVVRGG